MAINLSTLLNQNSVQFCKAWVNFNGTGTPAIRSSYNVSSITKNGTGDYTVNFATAMTDANYSVSGAAAINGAFIVVQVTSQTTSACRIGTGYGNNGYYNVFVPADSGTICLQIFGN